MARRRGLRPIDDDFLRCLFRDNIPLAEFFLRIITGKSDFVIMNYTELKTITRYYKENPKGVEIMCQAFEETRNEGRAEGHVESTIANLRSLTETLNLTIAQAMNALKIPEHEQPKYLELLKTR